MKVSGSITQHTQQHKQPKQQTASFFGVPLGQMQSMLGNRPRDTPGAGQGAGGYNRGSISYGSSSGSYDPSGPTTTQPNTRQYSGPAPTYTPTQWLIAFLLGIIAMAMIQGEKESKNRPRRRSYYNH
jgi:hypothetical protein